MYYDVLHVNKQFRVPTATRSADLVATNGISVQPQQNAVANAAWFSQGVTVLEPIGGYKPRRTRFAPCGSYTRLETSQDVCWHP